MVTRPTPGDLTRYRASVANTLSESITVARTNATLDAVVVGQTGRIRLPTLPSFLLIPRWLIVVAFDADLVSGDLATRAGHGTWAIRSVLDIAEDVLRLVEAVKIRHADGTLALPSNQTVQLRQQGSNDLLTANGSTALPVVLDVAYAEPVPGNFALKMGYRLWYDTAWRFPDRHAPQEGDWLDWADPAHGGKERHAPLSPPAPDAWPMPVATALAIEVR